MRRFILRVAPQRLSPRAQSALNLPPLSTNPGEASSGPGSPSMSTSQTPKTKVVEIADVQNKPDIRHIAIDKVGIKDIRHPVLVKDRSQGVQHTIANFT